MRVFFTLRRPHEDKDRDLFPIPKSQGPQPLHARLRPS